MQPKIAKEVVFLKNFQNRFKYVADYKAALADMLREGLITELAYKEVLKPFKSPEIIKPKAVESRPINIIPVDPEPDPCHKSYYRRNPC